MPTDKGNQLKSEILDSGLQGLQQTILCMALDISSKWDILFLIEKANAIK